MRCNIILIIKLLVLVMLANYYEIPTVNDAFVRRHK
jgi:hypothetical protein